MEECDKKLEVWMEEDEWEDLEDVESDLGESSGSKSDEECKEAKGSRKRVMIWGKQPYSIQQYSICSICRKSTMKVKRAAVDLVVIPPMVTTRTATKTVRRRRTDAQLAARKLD